MTSTSMAAESAPSAGRALTLGETPAMTDLLELADRLFTGGPRPPAELFA